MGHRAGKNTSELRNRLQAALTGWKIMVSFWTARVRLKIRFLVFYAVFVNAIVSGLEALVLAEPEFNTLASAVMVTLKRTLKMKMGRSGSFQLKKP